MTPNISKHFRFDYFIRKWLITRQKDVEKKKVKIKKYASMFEEFFGSEDLREIKTFRIQDFYENLPSHLSPKTQKNIMSCLHKVFTVKCQSLNGTGSMKILKPGY